MHLRINDKKAASHVSISHPNPLEAAGGGDTGGGDMVEQPAVRAATGNYRDLHLRARPFGAPPSSQGWRTRPLSIEIVLDAHAMIGESATWVAEESALYWIDVKAPALYRFTPASRENRIWPLTSDIGGFALTRDGGAVVALREGLHCLDLHSGALHRLAEPTFDPALFRYNEGACDAAGRFWIGVMFDPVSGEPPAQKSSLHSFTFDGGLRNHADESDLHNGMAWSPDGGTFYLSHSYPKHILAYDFDDRCGTISGRRIVATVEDGNGIPDGAAVDVEGGYWCALHGAGKIRRHRADGTIDRDIVMPVSQPTMCAFGGEELATLYVTSAADNLSEAQRSQEPHAGALFRLNVGTRGISRRTHIAASAEGHRE